MTLIKQSIKFIIYALHTLMKPKIYFNTVDNCANNKVGALCTNNSVEVKFSLFN